MRHLYPLQALRGVSPWWQFALSFVLAMGQAIAVILAGQSAAQAETIFGVTIDNPWYASESEAFSIRDALASHSAKPTVRVVFDECMEIAARCAARCGGACYDPAEYHEPVQNIKQAAFVMGEVLDSAYVQDYSVQDYIDRTAHYLDLFEGIVDIWEIGNEVNGEWVGDPASVVAKIEGAYAAVKARGKVTALNLYYNAGCWEKPEHEMFAWVQANLSSELRNGLDYVFFSYYEDDCTGPHTQEEWQAVFDQLHTLFPTAKLGFGEIGTAKYSQKADMMVRYYHQLSITGDYFVGGYFWWYYRQDCVPKWKRHWSILETGVIPAPDSAGSWRTPAYNLLL